MEYMEERLQKIMSAAGVASRRKAEEMILAGRVRVNGVTVRELGAKADAMRDEVRVDGKLISTELAHAYIMLHKPEGYVTTTSDPEGRPTVMDLVKKLKRRVYPVGRLDWATSGLLLLTSDGELTRFLTHPSSKVPKTYYVKLQGRIGDAALKKLAAGPDIGGPPLKPSRASFVKFSRGGTHSWIEMTVSEGRTRQIRRMGEAVGHPVLKLKRTALGPLLLGDLPSGEWRFLTDREIAALKKLLKQKS
jgi:23S rRNA pseudouridine2605 synthase